jgi:hypothetical protein
LSHAIKLFASQRWLPAGYSFLALTPFGPVFSVQSSAISQACKSRLSSVLTGILAQSGERGQIELVGEQSSPPFHETQKS